MGFTNINAKIFIESFEFENEKSPEKLLREKQQSPRVEGIK